MKSKKSEMSMNVLVVLIIVLLGAIVLGVLIFNVVKDLGKSGSMETCRESILLASTSREITGEPSFSLKCDRQELLFKKSEIVKDGVVDQEKVSSMVLDAMAECWYMMGEGKLDPFSSIDTLGNTYCMICKEIKFDNSLKLYLESYNHDSADYNPFENSLLMPLGSGKIMPGKAITYNEYFGHVPATFTRDRISVEDLIIQDGSFIGLSAFKVENYDTCTSYGEPFERPFYMLGGQGHETNDVALKLFLAPPINLRDYDLSGTYITEEENNFFEDYINFQIDANLLILSPGLYVGFKDCIDKTLGRTTGDDKSYPMCKIIIN